MGRKSAELERHTAYGRKMEPRKQALGVIERLVKAGEETCAASYDTGQRRGSTHNNASREYAMLISRKGRCCCASTAACSQPGSIIGPALARSTPDGEAES